MIRVVTMTAMVLALAACTTSGTQSSGLPASNNAEEPALVASAAANEVPADTPAAGGEVISYIEAPEVEKSAMRQPEQRDDLICRRERVLGSHRTEKVCRTRGEMKSTRDATQEALREASRRTGASANSN